MELYLEEAAVKQQLFVVIPLRSGHNSATMKYEKNNF